MTGAIRNREGFGKEARGVALAEGAEYRAEIAVDMNPGSQMNHWKRACTPNGHNQTLSLHPMREVEKACDDALPTTSN